MCSTADRWFCNDDSFAYFKMVYRALLIKIELISWTSWDSLGMHKRPHGTDKWMNYVRSMQNMGRVTFHVRITIIVNCIVGWESSDESSVIEMQLDDLEGYRTSASLHWRVLASLLKLWIRPSLQGRCPPVVIVVSLLFLRYRVKKKICIYGCKVSRDNMRWQWKRKKPCCNVRASKIALRLKPATFTKTTKYRF